MYCYITFYFFQLANDKLDANNAEEFALRTIINIGPTTTHDIYTKRPYDDEEDLYKKIKINERAKKRIKVVKNIN